MIDYNEFVEEGYYTKKEKTATTLFLTFVFSHFGLFLVVTLYAIGGAFAFISLELPNEMVRYQAKQMKAVEVNQTLNYVTDLFWYYQGMNWTNFKTYNDTMYRELKKLELYIISCVNNYGYDGTVTGWVYSWTFPKALLLTITIMTTIGYGNTVPLTNYGRLFCIFFAITGCPIFLVFISKLGSVMAHASVYVYSRFCCRWCRTRRYDEELPPNVSKRQRKLILDDDVGNEEYMPTNRLNVPITVNLVLMTAYIMLGGVLNSKWEGWDLLSSCYFTFISLSTIGYGDLVPGQQANETSSTNNTKMIICVLYIIIGIALVSMCINLMQDELVGKCHWLARELGITKPEEVKEIKEEEENNKETKKKKKKDKKKKKNSNDAEENVLPVEGGNDLPADSPSSVINS
nr:TWiK family of potassium channels protein 7-like [Cherax quadricarinatus]